MAKVPISVRLHPRTIERIDEAARKMHMTRGQLISESLDAAFDSEFGPLEVIKAIASDRVSDLVGYMNSLETAAVRQSESLTQEDREKVRKAISE